MKRWLQSALNEVLKSDRQMAFLLGPRQAGKTWLARHLSAEVVSFSWDVPDDRRLILVGGRELAERAGLDRLADRLPTIIFDELHKFPRWKDFLKGFFDTWEGRCRIVVTGSAALDAFSRGGDSLMGRYFLWHCHPLAWGEILADPEGATLDAEDALWKRYEVLGGFPEPFLRGDAGFWRRWRALRWKQLFREDVRDLTASLDLDRIEVLGHILLEQATGQCTWSTLATRLQVSQDTLRRWVSLLESLHTVFLLRPWSTNISRSLLKEPKVYFADWSWIAERGARVENLVACQLRAHLSLWQDTGLGEFGLWYLRDKDGREADFLVSRDGKPWMVLEVKASETSLSSGFLHLVKLVGAPHNFQLVADLPEVKADPFVQGAEPLVVPLRTFLRRWRPEVGLPPLPETVTSY